MTTNFIEATVDPVGREDRTKDLTSKNYYKNLLSNNSAKTLSGEERDKEEVNCPWVVDTRLSKTQVAGLIVVTSVEATTRRLGWERECQNIRS